MKLSKIFSAVFAMLTLFVGISIAQETQWANTQVILRSDLVGRGANFYLNTHGISQDICIIFALDSTSYNVVGQPDFTGTRITIPASSGSGDVYIGRFAAASNAAWYAYVTFSYRGGACAYSENQAAPVPNGLKLTSYHTVANLDYHKGFTVDAPVTLTTDGPTQGTTNQGRPFTQTTYAGVLPNDDTYMVSVCDYGFALSDADLDRVTDGFAGGVNGTVTSRRRVTVSGYTAAVSVIESVKNGRTIRFGLLIVIRGNSAYMFVFGTWLDTTGTNMADVETFFKSAALN